MLWANVDNLVVHSDYQYYPFYILPVTTVGIVIYITNMFTLLRKYCYSFFDRFKIVYQIDTLYHSFLITLFVGFIPY